MTSMDRLKECALKYESYLNYKYIIKLGKKGKLREFEILFHEHEFHHLVGLHKLVGNETILKEDRKKIFYEIINDRITYQDIKNLKNISEVDERIALVNQLLFLIDSNDIIKVWHKKYSYGSKIEADYIYKNLSPSGDSYMFSRSCYNQNEQNMISTFKHSIRDYTSGQEYWTLIYKEKINTLTHTSTVLLDKVKP